MTMLRVDPRIELRLAPEVTVTVVIGPLGVERHHLNGDENFPCFMVPAVRVGDGPLHCEVSRPVYVPDLGVSPERIAPLAVLRVVVRTVVDARISASAMLLARVLGPADDAELAATADRLWNAPAFYDDPLLGRFDVSGGSTAEVSDVPWAGRPIDLTIWDIHYPANVDLLADGLATAHALWRDQHAWERQARDFAVADLFHGVEDWRESDVPITPTEFSDRMTLRAIWIHPGGRFRFYFDGDDLYGDHAIRIRGTLAGGMHEAAIEG